MDLLGGIENVEHLDRVKIREHALLTYQLIGKLDYNIEFVEVNYNNGPVNYEVLKFTKVIDFLKTISSLDQQRDPESKTIRRGGMRLREKHKLGDYLYKNENIYKIVPHWDNNSESSLYSIFLQESTGKMYNSPYLIKNDDSSYIKATLEQIKKFNLAEKLYQ